MRPGALETFIQIDQSFGEFNDTCEQLVGNLISRSR